MQVGGEEHADDEQRLQHTHSEQGKQRLVQLGRVDHQEHKERLRQVGDCFEQEDKQLANHNLGLDQPQERDHEREQLEIAE